MMDSSDEENVGPDRQIDQKNAQDQQDEDWTPPKPKSGFGDSAAPPQARTGARPRPGRKSGGWGNGNVGDGNDSVPAPRQGNMMMGGNDAAQGRRGGRDRGGVKQGSSIDKIVDLDALQDLGEDGDNRDITWDVAEAPNVASHTVPSLASLDHDIGYSMLSNTDGLDLSLLTSVLMPQEQLKERDSLWDWDTIFTLVTSEMQTEEETKKEHENKAEDDDTATSSKEPEKSTSSDRHSRTRG